MNSRLVSQDDSGGRHYTTWTGSVRSLKKKIPHFTQDIFKIEKGINKYMDCIVREPLPDIREDMGIDAIRDEVGYPEAATGDRIPITAVRNLYGSKLFRGKMQGYKLVSHHQLLDEVLAVLANPRRDVFAARPDLWIDDIEALEATMRLSIYGARMYIEFLLPDYRKDSYILKVTCRNSVDKKHALTINLFLQSAERAEFFKPDKPDIPFYGFYHVHTNELPDDAIWKFMFTAVDKFLSGRWRTDEVDYDDLVRIIDSTLLPPQVISVIEKLDAEKRKTVTIGRFFEILSQLIQVGRNIFKNEEQKLTMLAILTEALLQLTQESETEKDRTLKDSRSESMGKGA